MSDPKAIEQTYELARQRYAEVGVDTDSWSAALKNTLRYRCTAGKETTWAASRIRTPASTAASP